MSKNNYAVIIFKLPSLFNILNELSDHLNFIIFSDKDMNNLEIKNFLSVILISKHDTNLKFEQYIIKEIPINIINLIEKINLSILRQQFLKKSNFLNCNFKFDTNLKTIRYQDKMIKLTEKEMNILIYMMKCKRAVSVNELENIVWNYKTDLETHTVETHIYRLRKKIKEVFNIIDLIIKEKNGYSLNIDMIK